MIILVFKDGHKEYISMSITEFEAKSDLYMTDEVEYATYEDMED